MSERSLADAEKKLGYALPDILKTFLGLVGNHRPLMEAHAHILKPGKYYETAGGLVIQEENQRYYYEAILKAELSSDDPPVVQSNQGEDVWYDFCPRLSIYLLDLFSWQLVNMLPVMGAIDSNAASLMEPLANTRIRLIHEETGQLRSYAGSGWFAIWFHPKDAVYLAALSDKALRAFERQYLEVDWL